MHGTRTNYNTGCRCEPCKLAAAAYRKARKHKDEAKSRERAAAHYRSDPAASIRRTKELIQTKNFEQLQDEAARYKFGQLWTEDELKIALSDIPMKEKLALLSRTYGAISTQMKVHKKG
jgi:hypothetical protein